MPEYSQLGAAGAVVVVVYLFLRFMRDEGVKRDESHLKLTDAIDRNTEVTNETYKYLKHRNGSFEKLIKEAPALHELLKEHDKVQ